MFIALAEVSTTWFFKKPMTSGVRGTHRFPEGQLDLPAQCVEEVGRRREVADEPVGVMQLLHLEVLVLRWVILRVIVAHLQEAFGTRARVLRSLQQSQKDVS